MEAVRSMKVPWMDGWMISPKKTGGNPNLGTKTYTGVGCGGDLPMIVGNWVVTCTLT